MRPVKLFLEAYPAAYPAIHEGDLELLPSPAELKTEDIAYLEASPVPTDEARISPRSFMSGRTSAGH